MEEAETEKGEYMKKPNSLTLSYKYFEEEKTYLITSHKMAKEKFYSN